MTSHPPSAGVHRHGQCPPQGQWIAHGMVRGETAHDGVGVQAMDDGRGETDRRSGAAGSRLDDDVLVRDLGKLSGDGGGMGRTADDQRLRRDRRSARCDRPSVADSDRSERIGRRNFGRATRLSGHRRVPEPPAGTTAQRRRLVAVSVIATPGEPVVSMPSGRVPLVRSLAKAMRPERSTDRPIIEIRRLCVNGLDVGKRARHKRRS